MSSVKKQQENEILEVKKSKEADLESKKSTWFLIGYVLVLAALFVVFEWTTTDKEETGDVIDIAISIEEEILIPITIPEKKVVPPPPQAKQITDIIKIVEEENEVVEDELASVEDQGEVIEIVDNANIVVEDLPDEDVIHNIVEDQPEFPGGMQALMKYLQENIKYPRISRENNSQGRTYVQFVVNTDGSIQDVTVMKSSSDVYLDKEAVRVVEGMPKWSPGMQAGKPVRVRFTLPVLFRLR